jgi:hypothetical protein
MKERFGSAPDLMIDMITILKVELDQTRTRGRHSWTKISQTIRDDVTEFTIYFALPRGAGDPPDFISSSGARLVSIHIHPDGEVFAFRFGFPALVPKGTFVHLDFVFDAPLRAPFAGLALARRVREAVVDIEFHPDGVPDWVEVASGDPVDLQVRFISPVERASIVATATNVGPGPFFVRWSDE